MEGRRSPCGACKFLRKKCKSDCIFFPYFQFEQALDTFAAIHKVFSAKNASKLLALAPVSDRRIAAATLMYEARARLLNPTYGCVFTIITLQQQVSYSPLKP